MTRFTGDIFLPIVGILFSPVLLKIKSLSFFYLQFISLKVLC